VGGVLSRTFSAVWKSPALVLGLSLVGVTASEVSSEVARFVIRSGGAVLPNILNGCVSLFISMFIQGALTYAAFQVFTGENVSAGASVARVFSRAGQLFAIAVIQSLLTGAAMTVACIPGVVLGPLWIFPAAGAVALFFVSMWCASVPACVVEKLGPVASIGRSRKLTEGCRVKIIGVMAVVLALFYVLRYAASSVGENWFGAGHAVSASVIAVTFIPYAFTNTAVAAVYYALRSAKENIIDMSLAEIFD
jgi:hypothetical protein